MLTAITCVGFQELARDVERDDGPFTCPGCARSMLIKKGLKKIHHFAHVSDACPYGSGESEEHHSAKLGIYEWLLTQEGVSDVCVEHAFGDVRPDVSFLLRGQRVGVEVQRSNLTLEEVQRKTRAYIAEDLAIQWVLLPGIFGAAHKQCNQAVRVKDWAQWIHDQVHHILFIWINKCMTVYHLIDFYSWVGGSSWYDSYGNERSGGDYARKLNTFRIIQRREEHLIINPRIVLGMPKVMRCMDESWFRYADEPKSYSEWYDRYRDRTPMDTDTYKKHKLRSVFCDWLKQVWLHRNRNSGILSYTEDLTRTLDLIHKIGGWDIPDTSELIQGIRRASRDGLRGFTNDDAVATHIHMALNDPWGQGWLNKRWQEFEASFRTNPTWGQAVRKALTETPDPR